MKKYPLSIIAAACLGVLAGCGTTSTFSSRIKENQAEFDKLSATDQQIVRNGFIKVGYPQSMVYVALEAPERKIPGSVPNEETWVYHNFYASDGSSQTPAQKIKTNPGSKPNNNTFSVVPDTAQENIKADAVIKVHVKFVDGKVAAIDIVRPN
jgi:outer membrane lipoprotein-sorting protein